MLIKLLLAVKEFIKNWILGQDLKENKWSHYNKSHSLSDAIELIEVSAVWSCKKALCCTLYPFCFIWAGLGKTEGKNSAVCS